MLKKFLNPDVKEHCPNCRQECSEIDILCPNCGENLEELFEKLPDSEIPTTPSNWLLFIGLTGVSNFFMRAWSLLPPTRGRIVFFWFVKFYDDLFLFFLSLAFLSIGVFSIALWFSRFTSNSIVKVVVTYLGMLASIVCLFPAFGTYAFLSTSFAIEDIKHNGYYYHVVGYYDEMAVEYYFCKSDELGFSGKCEYIYWNMTESPKPKLFIDTVTKCIVVEFEEPHYYWINSNPPTYATNLSEIRSAKNLVNNECAP